MPSVKKIAIYLYRPTRIKALLKGKRLSRRISRSEQRQKQGDEKEEEEAPRHAAAERVPHRVSQPGLGYGKGSHQHRRTWGKPVGK